MMKFLLSLMILLSSCALIKKEEDNEMRSIIREVLNEKGSPGIRIEIIRLQPPQQH